MDWLTFIASLIESLVWPTATTIILLTFKSELKSIVPFLSKFKAGPVEAEFDRDIQQLRALARSTGSAQTISPIAKASSEFLIQLGQLHPRSAILESWVRLEAAARATILNSQSAADSDQTRYIPAASLPKALVSMGKFDQDDATLFHELRRLRNDVAHLVAPEPTQESVRSYIDLATKLQNQLERANFKQNLTD